MAWSVRADNKRSFRIAMRVLESDTPLNLSARTENLEELHRIMCAMDNFRTPMKEWYSAFVHEELEDGVREFTHLEMGDAYDHLYGFKGRKEAKAVDSAAFYRPESQTQTTINIPWPPAMIEEKKEKAIGAGLTLITNLRAKPRKLSSSVFIDNRRAYAH